MLTSVLLPATDILMTNRQFLQGCWCWFWTICLATVVDGPPYRRGTRLTEGDDYDHFFDYIIFEVRRAYLAIVFVVKSSLWGNIRNPLFIWAGWMGVLIISLTTSCKRYNVRKMTEKVNKHGQMGLLSMPSKRKLFFPALNAIFTSNPCAVINSALHEALWRCRGPP